MHLPTPSLADQNRSLALSEIIQAKTPLPFSEFMSLALYAPKLGYYQQNKVLIGRGGDFITAPKISPLFAHSIATSIWPVLSRCTKPACLEFGAGSGSLAADLLIALGQRGFTGIYYILELSASLQAQQKETIAEKAPSHLEQVIWLNTLPTQAIEGVILANEVLDAFPCERFRIDQGLVDMAFVTYQEKQGFSWSWQTATTELSHEIKHLNFQDYPEPYINEVCTLIRPWLQSLEACLEKGLVLLIDYGYAEKEYYHPEYSDGHLHCHYAHLRHDDPFFYPGLQDITTHVNFTQVARAAVACGFDLAGFTSQAHFLIETGILETPEITPEISLEIKRLIMPQEMGETFKAIALTKNDPSPVLGFQQWDFRRKL